MAPANFLGGFRLVLSTNHLLLIIIIILHIYALLYHCCCKQNKRKNVKNDGKNRKGKHTCFDIFFSNAS